MDFESYVKSNDAILKNMQSQGQSTQNQCQNIQNQNQNLQIQMAALTEMMSKLVNSNTASTSGSGTLPGNTITNPKEDLKVITTRSGVAYQGPKTPSPSKQGTKVLGFLDTTASGNPTPIDDPIISTTSPTRTLFRDSDFLLFEEANAFLGLEDDPDAPKINPFYYDP
nr:reverse transcriptase domain-containing protein [Tanacetum cinerariifolium]